MADVSDPENFPRNCAARCRIRLERGGVSKQNVAGEPRYAFGIRKVNKHPPRHAFCI